MRSTSEHEERNERIYMMRKDGATYCEISRVFGISCERARQIEKRERHEREGCWDFAADSYDGYCNMYCTYCGKRLERPDNYE